MSHLRATGFYRDFPPEGSEVVFWVVAMSYGFIIHLRLEPDGLRSLNRFMEQKAWGAFRYEVYLSYDFEPIAGDSERIGEIVWPNLKNINPRYAVISSIFSIASFVSIWN